MVSNCAEVSADSAVESLAGFDDETLNQMTANRQMFTFTRLAVSALDGWQQEKELGKYERHGDNKY